MADELRPVTTHTLLKMKEKAERIVMLTCYDALFARLLDASGVDALLVGDSVNQVLAGAETTLSATLEQMIYHTKIVRRGAQRAMVVCDMPYLTYQVTPALAPPASGVGGGRGGEGRVLVLHDMRGLNERVSAKVGKKYAPLAGDVGEAVSLYAAGGRGGRYPGPGHSFGGELPPPPPL